MGAGGVEPPTVSLEDCCSIQLSYTPIRPLYPSGGELYTYVAPPTVGSVRAPGTADNSEERERYFMIRPRPTKYPLPAGTPVKLYRRNQHFISRPGGDLSRIPKPRPFTPARGPSVTLHASGFLLKIIYLWISWPPEPLQASAL